MMSDNFLSCLNCNMNYTYDVSQLKSEEKKIIQLLSFDIAATVNTVFLIGDGEFYCVRQI